jgi:hypothetical protein
MEFKCLMFEVKVKVLRLIKRSEADKLLLKNSTNHLVKNHARTLNMANIPCCPDELCLLTVDLILFSETISRKKVVRASSH